MACTARRRPVPARIDLIALGVVGIFGPRSPIRMPSPRGALVTAGCAFGVALALMIGLLGEPGPGRLHEVVVPSLEDAVGGEDVAEVVEAAVTGRLAPESLVDGVALVDKGAQGEGASVLVAQVEALVVAQAGVLQHDGALGLHDVLDEHVITEGDSAGSEDREDLPLHGDACFCFDALLETSDGGRVLDFDVERAPIYCRVTIQPGEIISSQM